MQQLPCVVILVKLGGGGGELLPTKFKLFIDIKFSKWIIIKNNTKLTLTQPEMLATRMGESWTHYHSIYPLGKKIVYQKQVPVLITCA